MSDPTPRPDGETRPTDHDRIDAALLAHFHGPGYNAVGHGTPDDCAPCHEATHVVLAEVASLTEDLAAARAEIEHLKLGYGRELMNTEEQLALALGMTKGEHGYPVGDHTTVSLAMWVRDELSASRRVVEAARAVCAHDREGWDDEDDPDGEKELAHERRYADLMADLLAAVDSLPAQHSEETSNGR